MSCALSLDNTVARAIDADERVRQAKARHEGGSIDAREEDSEAALASCGTNGTAAPERDKNQQGNDREDADMADRTNTEAEKDQKDAVNYDKE